MRVQICAKLLKYQCNGNEFRKTLDMHYYLLIDLSVPTNNNYIYFFFNNYIGLFKCKYRSVQSYKSYSNIHAMAVALEKH